jgi:hypothetical protein
MYEPKCEPKNKKKLKLAIPEGCGVDEQTQHAAQCLDLDETPLTTSLALHLGALATARYSHARISYLLPRDCAQSMQPSSHAPVLPSQVQLPTGVATADERTPTFTRTTSIPSAWHQNGCGAGTQAARVTSRKIPLVADPKRRPTRRNRRLFCPEWWCPVYFHVL